MTLSITPLSRSSTLRRVRDVLADACGTPTPTPAEGYGLRLIQKWARMANGTAIETAVPTR